MQLAVPGVPAVRADREQPGLRRAGVRLVEVERDAGGGGGGRDAFEPFVDEQPGVGAPRWPGRRPSRPRWPPGPRPAVGSGRAAVRASDRRRSAAAGRVRSAGRPAPSSRRRGQREVEALRAGRTWLSCSSQRRTACGSTACSAADWPNAACTPAASGGVTCGSTITVAAPSTACASAVDVGQRWRRGLTPPERAAAAGRRPGAPRSSRPAGEVPGPGSAAGEP